MGHCARCVAQALPPLAGVVACLRCWKVHPLTVLGWPARKVKEGWVALKGGGWLDGLLSFDCMWSQVSKQYMGKLEVEVQ